MKQESCTLRVVHGRTCTPCGPVELSNLSKFGMLDFPFSFVVDCYSKWEQYVVELVSYILSLRI